MHKTTSIYFSVNFIVSIPYHLDIDFSMQCDTSDKSIFKILKNMLVSPCKAHSKM